jgi:hypothetical protein
VPCISGRAWDMAHFAAAHIFFADNDYLPALFSG